MRPGLTTITQASGAPLPLPMRVSCGFLVIGLSGNMRIQMRPFRLMKRVIAMRPASISRAVTQPHSVALRPKSPKARCPPVQALPLMRPRCCFLNLTFFGINMANCPRSGDPARLRRGLGLAPVDPGLDPDLTERGVGLVEAEVEVGAQGVQRQLAVQVPLGARDLGAVQAPGDADLDAARAEAQRRVHRLAHGAAEGDPFLELQRHRLGDQLRVELGLQDLLDVDEDLLARALLDLLLELVDLLPLAADDDARARGVDGDLQLVGRALDLDAADAGVGEALLEVLL